MWLNNNVQRAWNVFNMFSLSREFKNIRETPDSHSAKWWIKIAFTVENRLEDFFFVKIKKK